MKKLILLPALLFFFFSCKKDVDYSDELAKSDQTEQKITILNKIANAYGYKNWGNVEKVEFSFVVNPGGNEMSRSWEWMPKSGKVTLKKDTGSVSYQRDNLKQEDISTDKAFVNDSFWLLFPFHLVWDDIEYSVEENSETSLEAYPSTKITVNYPKEGGYTPGDKYVIHVNDDFHIIEWSYYPGGQENPGLINTFEDLTDYDGIKVNLTHSNPESGFQLNFRDVSFN